jgi:hypothetical protein
MNNIPINDNSSEPANTNGELAILARTRLYGACGTVETLTNLGKAFEFINEINIMLAAGCEHNFEFVAEGMNYVMEHLCALQDAATQLVEIETIKAAENAQQLKLFARLHMLYQTLQAKEAAPTAEVLEASQNKIAQFNSESEKAKIAREITALEKLLLPKEL